MSSVAHPHTPVRVRVRPSRLSILIVTALVICATVAAVILLTSSGSSHRSGASVAPTSQTGGPNEAARGQAAASAVGASSQPAQTGGPNEAARGRSAAAASRH
jgi:hypothetical protein